MDKRDIQYISEALTVLKNQKLPRVIRAATLAEFQFGDYIEKEFNHYEKGKIMSTNRRMVPKLQLHVDCCFRLICGDTIILSRGDIFEPTSVMENDPDFDWDQFDWDIIGNNRFDEMVERYFTNEENDFIVEDIKVSPLGDLQIDFTNGFILEVFTDISGADECWRFFELGSDIHTVITGQGLDDDEDEESSPEHE